MSKSYRKGGIGALMDEYERAAGELSNLVGGLSDESYGLLRDAKTQDEHCRSIQTIMSHVVNSGYGYANYIRRALSIPVVEYTYRVLERDGSLTGLKEMLAYTVETLEGRWEYSDEQIMAVRITARWGPQYDMEQILEHAIVHILRHRRQVEKFLNP